ncbi:hypothetical protein [Flavobacterium aquatile]|uniref:Uncharacterized protein n=1 Tax=Flavobacterium aquatile LMG 4008 = ATCC 11947 TaxID=1453498 RepID=A0A095V3K4_9FLAO|nr:hypothetical protein [Flavobacterium aquatile]KGD69445.1 hypothetical protein LG45_01355 [Flavobacterium aquatile LMG 4008 = ATCC 11947]OXA66099.1 hypothetical protein B0A61_12560 [Flavobacterium aquatile LMG 4008 = ATCC 11947]GEC77583.1 hypothetical protein FAQ01_04530 [Flavobacterium aquatile]
MPYDYTQEELYGRALFNFTHGNQIINVAFEPIGEREYMFIIFPEDSATTINPHDAEFIDTLNEILFTFDNGNKFTYEIAAF